MRDASQRMKSFARAQSSCVPFAGEQVGPERRYLERRAGAWRVVLRRLDRTQCSFGVRRPDDGRGGGFRGLASWTWDTTIAEEGTDDSGEVRIESISRRQDRCSGLDC